MAWQLEQDEPLTARLARPWSRVVVWERLARGGGTTNWYLAEDRASLSRVFDQQRGGSWVFFWFDDVWNVESDTDEARGRTFEAVTRHDEIVIGHPGPELGLFEVEYASGPTELTEELMLHPEGSLVVWREWPSTGEALDEVDVRLVDPDGRYRPHPH